MSMPSTFPGGAACERSIRIGLTQSRHLPTVRVQPRSEQLHSIGPDATVAAVAELVRHLCDDVAFSVGRLDLYADWQGWDLTVEDRDRFVTRADTCRTFQHRGQLSGFAFGTRKSHSLTARIYDKTLQIDQSGHDWWKTVWGARYCEDWPVHRVEFELSRQALSDFDLTSPAQVLAASADLWAYASEQWPTDSTGPQASACAYWPPTPTYRPQCAPSSAATPNPTTPKAAPPASTA